jgi:hypothetical protein
LANNDGVRLSNSFYGRSDYSATTATTTVVSATSTAAATNNKVFNF